MESSVTEHPSYRPKMSPEEVEAQCSKLISEYNFVGAVELWKDNIFLNEMTAAVVELEWYQALFEEDCLKIMTLLKINPWLVKEGWSRDPSRFVIGSSGRPWDPSETKGPWKGRTALHVSARRGCIELVKQVLELYDMKMPSLSDQKETEMSSLSDEKETDRVDREDASTFGDSDTRDRDKIAGGSSHDSNTRRKMSDNSCEDGGASNPCPCHDTIEQGKEVVMDHDASQRDQEIGEESGSIRGELGSGVKEAASTVGCRNVPVNDSIQETARQVVAHWTEKVKASKRGKINWARRGAVAWKLGNGVESPGEDNAGAGEDVPTNEDRNTDTPVIVSSSRKDLLDLLLSKDGEYEMDALAIAIIHFDSDLFTLLGESIRMCGTNPYDIVDELHTVSSEARRDDGYLTELLRKASTDVLTEVEGLDPTRSRWLLKYYAVGHRDFNFLPAKCLEYLFLYWFTSFPSFWPPADIDRSVRKCYGLDALVEICRVRSWKKIKTVGGDSLWRFVSELQDGQGRTAAHVAVDELLEPEEYCRTFEGEEEEVFTHFFTRSDGAGRTPLYRIAARWGFSSDFADDLRQRFRDDVIATANHTVWTHSAIKGRTIFDKTIPKLAALNGFANNFDGFGVGVCHSPFLANIISRRFWGPSMTSMLSTSSFDFHKTSYKHVLPAPVIRGRHSPRKIIVKLDALEFACLLEDGSTVVKNGIRDVEDRSFIIDEILKSGYLARSNSSNIGTEAYPNSTEHPFQTIEGHPFHALHIIAALGNYQLLKLFIDDSYCDPFVEDSQGNCALHYALREPFDCIQPSLLNYVSCEDLFRRQEQVTQKNICDEKDLLERQGCVNLLVQVGCEIFKGNKNGEVPYPQGRLSTSVTFSSWWYEKQEKEFGAIKSNLNIATNAISVTATLVATASYVGPLQPPLGYALNSNNQNQIQYQNGLVATFLFCDSLSFYLAIIAIVISIIPSLPVPKQPMVQELQKMRIMMIVAVSVLIPSIMCVLVAFASSSVAVVSSNIVSSLSGKLTIATLSISGPLLLGAFSLFLIRLLYILSPQTHWIRYLNKQTSF